MNRLLAFLAGVIVTIVVVLLALWQLAWRMVP
jgi:hypothetical protein